MDRRTKETVKVFDDAAEGYQKKYMDVTSYADSLTLFCELLSSDECNVFDVACGPGNVAKFIVNKVPEVKLLASDLSKKMLTLTKINVPSADTILMDAKKIKTIDRKFEGVLASFIFPYLSKNEALDFIRDTREILTRDGLLYISTIQGKNSDSCYIGPTDGIQMYMNYHEVNYLEQALISCGFEIVSSKLQPYNYGVNNNGIDIIIIGKLKS